MVNSAEKIRLAGNQNVMVCECGTMLGYSKASSAPFDLLIIDSNTKSENKQSYIYIYIYIVL
jgi:3-deoxy-D-manno-octulosonic acid (KDO) 8-phosphate synthase